MAAWKDFFAQSATYELVGNELTRRSIVAKSSRTGSESGLFGWNRPVTFGSQSDLFGEDIGQNLEVDIAAGHDRHAAPAAGDDRRSMRDCDRNRSGAGAFCDDAGARHEQTDRRRDLTHAGDE